MNYLADNKKTFFDSFSEQFNSVLTEQKNKAINEQNALKNKTEQERERLKREYQNTQSTIIETQDKCKRDLTETLNRELAKWQQFARQSVVLMPPYKTTKANNVHCLYLQNDEIPTLKDLRKEQEERIFLPALPVGMKGINVDDTQYYLPVYADWQGKNDDKQANFYITYDETSAEQAYNLHKAMFIRMLAAFTTGNISFTCINPNNQPQCGSYWIKRLLEETISDATKRETMAEQLFCTKNYAFCDDNEIKERMLSLQNRITNCAKQLNCNSWREYNQNNKEITIPYEVVLVYEPFVKNRLASWHESMQELICNGYKAGIYFIVIQGNKNNSILADQRANAWTNSGWEKIFHEHFIEIECTEGKKGICALHTQQGGDDNFSNITLTDWGYPAPNDLFPITDEVPQDGLFKDLLTKMVDNFEAVLNKRAEKRQTPLQKWIVPPYKYAWDNKIEVPIGRVNGKTEHYFCLNEDTKVHSFIVGGTGSGKSVLLEDIIVGATAKYHPDSLQLYLCDFKGANTFSPYSQLPHVRYTIRDHEKAVQYAMLHELLAEMRRRNKLFGKDGENQNTLSEYNNRRHNEKDKLPMILIIYDEFQNFFTKGSEGTSSDLNKNIKDTLIAFEKEGRSAGIHIIKATQSIDGIESIFYAGQNNYVLKSKSDAIGNILSNNKAEVLDVLNTKWVTAAYQEGDTLFYTELYMLPRGEDENGKSKKDIFVEEIKNKARNATDIDKFVHAEYPSTELPPIYRYAEETLPSETTSSKEIGINLFGTKTIGVKLRSNVLIAGNMSTSSKELSLRIFFGLLRNTLESADQVYLFTTWAKQREDFEGMDQLYKLLDTNRITLCEDTDETRCLSVLQKIKAEFERRQESPDRHAVFPPIYVYILDYNSIDTFRRSQFQNIISEFLKYGKNLDIYTTIHYTDDISKDRAQQFDVQIFQQGVKTTDIADLWTLADDYGKKETAKVLLKVGVDVQLIWPFLLPDIDDKLFTVVPKNAIVQESAIEFVKRESNKEEQETSAIGNIANENLSQHPTTFMEHSFEIPLDENGKRDFRNSYRRRR